MKKNKKNKRPLRYEIGEQVVGYVSLGAAVIEVAAPAFLAIDLAAAGGLFSFGVLVVTGKANGVVKGLAEFLDGMSK